MSDQLASLPRILPVLSAGAVVPAIVVERGEQAAWRYLGFFAANTLRPDAYQRGVCGMELRCQRARGTAVGRLHSWPWRVTRSSM